MTISQILETSNKKMNPAQKLAKIRQIVTEVRLSYGNADCDLAITGTVNTCAGSQPIAYLSDKDKLALVDMEVSSIRCTAIENTQCTAGVVFEREVEKLVATSPLLSSLEPSVQSSII